MWDKIKTFVKTHPYESAAGVFVVGLILIYLFTRSSGSAATSDGSSQLSAAQLAAEASVDQAQVQGATQLAIAQAGATANQNIANTQLSALQTNDATQISLAQIDATNQQTINQQNVVGSIQGLQISDSTQLAALQDQDYTQQVYASLNASMHQEDDATQIFLGEAQLQETQMATASANNIENALIAKMHQS